MIYVSDLQQLVSVWTERLGNNSQPSSYKDALSECIYELNNLISTSILEEFTYQDFLEKEADTQLSIMKEYGEAV